MLFRSGTVEQVHKVTKNELGAGVMPCGRFGANAAWYRLAALTYNLLSITRRTALPEPLKTARPKRLRFQVLNRAGRIVHHARRLIVRVARSLAGPRGMLVAARRALRQLAETVRAARRLAFG